MNSKTLTKYGLLLSILMVLSYSSAEETINLASLVEELADRDSLAIHPAGNYTQHQASSYDRSDEFGLSRLGAPYGFANVDCGNFIRKVTIDGRTEWVMLEDEGPGAIIRWWATAANDRLLRNYKFRVYIDSNTTPVIEASPQALVAENRHGFGNALNYHTPARGGNLYGPIIFQDGILITWDGPAMHNGHAHIALDAPPFTGRGDEAIWYVINYRKFAPGPRVESYTPESVQNAKASLETLNQTLLHPGVTGDVDQQHQTQQTLQAQQNLSHTLKGPGAIRRLIVQLNAQDTAAALKDLQLNLSFDGKTTCQVPLGAFFGNGWSDSSVKPYNSGSDYMRSVSRDGKMVCYWVMPFAKQAEVCIQNTGTQAVDVELQIDSGDWGHKEGSMYFHADYIEELAIPTREEQFPRWPVRLGDADFRFLDVRGRGVYVGDTMSVRNRSTGPGNGSWWGEGDEKIYIDYLDENGNGSTALPDHIGTGTEDYYGYSFGSGREFTSPFVTQPNAAGNRRDNGALTVNGRVRGLDAIPFNKSLKFDMEVWKWREGNLDIGAVTYWYGAPGAVSLKVVADLAADLQQTATITDTAGDGTWEYFACSEQNPNKASAKLIPLTWEQVGDQGHHGFSNKQAFPALSNRFITKAGSENLGIQGRPGYHELAAHPGNNQTPYLVARWTAGISSAGLINISGIVRNLTKGGDSIDFALYTDGELIYQAKGNQSGGGQLPESYFDFDVHIQSGKPVDLVIGNNGTGNSQGDESMLRAVIRAPKS